MAGSVSLTNASLGDPESSNNSTNTTGTTIGPTALTSTLNAWLIDGVISETAGSFSSVGQAERWEETIGGAVAAMSTKEDVAAGANSMSQTHTVGGTNRKGHVAVSVAPFNSSTNIAFDSVASTTGTGNSIAWSHSLTTTNTSNTKLLVTIAFEEGGICNDTINSVTYGNLNLAQVAQAQIFGGGSCKQVEIWYADLTNIIVSTDNNSVLGGQAMDQDEAVEYDAAFDTGTLFFDDATFDANERLDALHQYRDGKLAISTAGPSSVGGNAIANGEIALLDPTGTSGVYSYNSIIFAESNFASGNENIDAVYIRDNDNIVLSTSNNANLPGIGNFDDDDIVEWNGTTASLVFDIASIAGAANNWDVDGVHFLNDDPMLILFSLYNNRTIGPITYENGDVLLYNRNTSTLSIYFSEDNFTANEDVDALTLAVPPFTGSTLDHFVITTDNFGIFCAAETITVNAVDTDGNNPFTTYDQQITLDTGTGVGDWSYVSGGTPGNFTNLGSGMATYLFSSSDGGDVTFSLDYTSGTVSSVDIEVYQTSDNTLRDDDTEGAIVYSPSGFTVTETEYIPPAAIINFNATQIAGVDDTIHITAYGTTATDTTCGVIEAYTGVQQLKFWSTYNNPNSGTIQVDIDTNSIAIVEGSSANQNVTFLSGKATVMLNYEDVGRIRIEMKDDSGSHPDLPTGIRGGTDLFVVKPARFTLSNIISPTVPGNCGAGTSISGVGIVDQNSTPTIAAGESFCVTVTAEEFGDGTTGNSTPNYGQEQAPNGAENVLLTPTIIAAGGANNPAIGFTTGFASFTNGISVGSDFNWPEVGIITLTPSVADADYLGTGDDVTGAVSANVGRFTPYVFEVTGSTPEFGTACGTFGYMGQPFTYTTAPVLNVVAKAKGIAPAFGPTTQNYTGLFFKFTDSKFQASGSRAYVAASGTLDLGNVLVPVPLAADPVIADTGSGTGTLTFSDGGGISFNRNAPEVPFDADIALSLNVVDEDDIFYGNGNGTDLNPWRFGTATVGNGIAFDNSKEQRWGRMVLDNAFGSELLPLEMTVRTEYYLSVDDEFVASTDTVTPANGDNCTTYTSANITYTNLTDLSGNPVATGAGTLVNGLDDVANPLILTNAAAQVPGYVDATHSTDFWLQYDWDNDANHDNDPFARLTWGIFSGSDEFIYIREPW